MKRNSPKKIVLFDGVCNLCNSAVNFIIDRDVHHQFLFAPLQSDIGRQLLEQHGLPPDALSSLILLDDQTVYIKSTGALRIVKKLRFPWPLLYVFIVMPSPIRNGIYDFIAKYRYKIFGKSNTCRYPSEDIKAKFLTDIN